jgi:hypothetical protein
MIASAQLHDKIGVSGVISTGQIPTASEVATVTPPPEEYRIVPLTQGQVAIIDAEDFARISAIKWCAEFRAKIGTFYATHSRATDNKRRTTLLMHRFLLDVHDRNQLVDHINHDTLDNRRRNLRVVSYSQSLMNRRVPRNNVNGVTGITFQGDRGKFRARIYISGKCLHLGYFRTIEEAARVREEAERKHYGEFRYCDDARSRDLN